MFSGILTGLGTRPTPASTLISSLAFLCVVVLLITAFRRLRSGRRSKESFFDRLVDRLRAFDKALVCKGSPLVGTAYPKPLFRRIEVPLTLTGIAVVSVVVPVPYGLFFVALGLIAILIIFRHWSRDEDLLRDFSDMNRVPGPDDREVPIKGDLFFELVTACAFVLVFACVAFAQIAEAGLAFTLKPTTGPAAFLVYSLIELLKAGSLVDYYDLFRDQLPYDRWSEVEHAGPLAKTVVLAYRITVNVLILAALKRILDIAQRKAEGRDLRDIRKLLEENDVEGHKQAVGALATFAVKRGRANAAVELERVLSPERRLGPEITFAAAEALSGYGNARGVSGALYAAASAYRRLIEGEWSHKKAPPEWAKAQNALAAALAAIGMREGSTDRLNEAVAAYRAALSEWKARKMLRECAGTQNGLGMTLASLAGLERDAAKAKAQLEEAVVTFRAVLSEWVRKNASGQWISAQNNIAGALMCAHLATTSSD